MFTMFTKKTVDVIGIQKNERKYFPTAAKSFKVGVNMKLNEILGGLKTG